LVRSSNYEQELKGNEPKATTMRFIVSHHTPSPKSMSLFIMTSWPLFSKSKI